MNGTHHEELRERETGGSNPTAVAHIPPTAAIKLPHDGLPVPQAAPAQLVKRGPKSTSE